MSVIYLKGGLNFEYLRNEVRRYNRREETINFQPFSMLLSRPSKLKSALKIRELGAFPSFTTREYGIEFHLAGCVRNAAVIKNSRV